MAKSSGKNSIILINGYNYSTYGTAFDTSQSAGMVDVTGFTDGGKNFIPGLPSASLNIQMLWDTTATVGATAVLAAFPSGNVSLLPEGYALGNPSLSLPYALGNFSPSGAPAGAVQLGTLEFANTGADAMLRSGWALAHATITNTATGTGVLDPADAAVTAKCGATLHVWTKCAADTYVVKVQHSSDNSNWADLITFVADGSALASESQVIASGTVNKYRRVLATRTGSASNPFGYSVTFWHG